MKRKQAVSPTGFPHFKIFTIVLTLQKKQYAFLGFVKGKGEKEPYCAAPSPAVVDEGFFSCCFK